MIARFAGDCVSVRHVQDSFEGKVDDSHFADPETMLLNDNTLTRHRSRLFWLDKSCRDALERFRCGPPRH